MRLRYLSIDRYPPLSNVRICFSADAPWDELGGESIDCGIHFVAGLNGSGKSHLLRAISSIFLGMADGELPGFPFTLVYELGKGEQFLEIIFDNRDGRKNEAAIWQRNKPTFKKNWDLDAFERHLAALRMGDLQGLTARVPKGSYPQSVKDLLPKVLAYTSGSWKPWQAIWQPPLSADERPDIQAEELYDAVMERPAGWTDRDESAARFAGASYLQSTPVAHVNNDASDLLSRPFLLSDNRPDAALLAVALHDGLASRNAQSKPRLTQLLQKAGWQQLVCVRLRIDLDKVKNAPATFQRKIHDLLLIAGEVISLPHPTRLLRMAYFDVDSVVPDTRVKCLDEQLRTDNVKYQGDALTLMLGERSESPFSRFHELIRWMALGLIDDVEMCIRRNVKPDDDEAWHDKGIMAYSEMSDGEQMVLRRWALFYLLAGEPDSLLLLDEPETHFNDSWKRQIVSIIEHAMGKDNSAVLVASHSSIVLSDVFDQEVIHISKDTEGHATARPLNTRTFGTDPGALVMKVFDAEDSIGIRAKQRIEAFLTHVSQTAAPTREDISKLESVINSLGTGFYRSELRTVLYRWKQSDDVRALNQLLPTLGGPMKEGVLELLKKHIQSNAPDA
ncbi:AAA family ATPase [Pseudomonas sp. 13B_2.1_Bac1]|uniref:AAA family ATPase n=1 Tax=Pseudomonas sp. 13B_2.1_Bac1 TaxID=2971624 RepID=UPI0021CAC7A2|nr:AAA family ATPase [Pseudomonas sp. 13B_2.1_Bac1]MCU1783670.1 AAA family ATPase [Pseudomonas sp. 13B_2.1_Bac1]